MLETILASYGASYLILGYLELMEELSDYVYKKIIDKDKERMQELEKKLLKDLKKLERELKKNEQMYKKVEGKE